MIADRVLTCQHPKFRRVGERRRPVYPSGQSLARSDLVTLPGGVWDWYSHIPRGRGAAPPSPGKRPGRTERYATPEPKVHTENAVDQPRCPGGRERPPGFHGAGRDEFPPTLTADLGTPASAPLQPARGRSCVAPQQAAVPGRGRGGPCRLSRGRRPAYAGRRGPVRDWQCACESGYVRCVRRVPKRGTICEPCARPHLNGYHAVKPKPAR